MVPRFMRSTRVSSASRTVAPSDRNTASLNQYVCVVYTGSSVPEEKVYLLQTPVVRTYAASSLTVRPSRVVNSLMAVYQILSAVTRSSLPKRRLSTVYMYLPFLEMRYSASSREPPSPQKVSLKLWQKVVVASVPRSIRSMALTNASCT